MALVARVVATTNRQEKSLLAFRPTYTLYRIHVRHFGDRHRSWCVLRRYSEFVELRASLGASVGVLPELPPKLVLNSTDELAERYHGLDGFLRALLSLPLAAAHTSVRSFLGAAEAGGTSGTSGTTGVSGFTTMCDSTTIEDDWEHAPELGTDPDTSAGVDDEPCWLLSGSWIADEERSRDGLDPMLRAMGTPWPVRRMLRGLTIISSLVHVPGERLEEARCRRCTHAPPPPATRAAAAVHAPVRARPWRMPTAPHVLALHARR
jgi:hypothetical protein